jgi:iron(III) transport system permease protein
MQIHQELEEAAQVSGASWFRTMTRVTLPLMVPAMLSVWIWVAAHALRELSAALILRSRENVVLSTLLWGLWEIGEVPMVAGMGVTLTVILIILIVLSRLLARRGRVAMLQEL